MSLQDTSVGLKREEKRLETGTTIERLETVTVQGSVSGVFESHNQLLRANLMQTSCKSSLCAAREW